MIELRWVEREVAAEITRFDTGGGFRKVKIERVLQYRVEVGPRGERWWGDWQDVPVVEDTGHE